MVLGKFLRDAPKDAIKLLDFLMGKLSGEDREKWLRALSELNQGRNPWKYTEYLQYLRTLTLPAVTGFDVRDHFRIDNPFGVNIGYICEGFDKDFLSGDDWLVDAPAAGVEVNRLLHPDHPLTMGDLGGEKKVLLPLPHIWTLMEAQGACQPGNLSTDRDPCSFSNIFLTRNRSGELRQISLGVWPGDGWAVVSNRVMDENVIWRRGTELYDGVRIDYRLFTL